jgi:hypothetical protein
MTDFHKHFNNVMLTVVNKIKGIAKKEFPDNAKLHKIIEVVIMSPTLNVFKPMEIFINEVYKKYKKELESEDEDFFMDLNIDENNDLLSAIKSVYKSLSQTEKKEIKSNIRIMTKICAIYNGESD